MSRLGSRLPNLGSAANFAAVDEDIVFVGPQKITSDAGSIITIEPGAGALTKIGSSGTPSISTPTANDFFISGRMDIVCRRCCIDTLISSGFD